MIRVLAVDDDPSQLRLMRKLVAAQPSLEWIGEARNAQDAAGIIREKKPDALFLDIQMPRASGIDLVRGLEIAPKVVFITASSSHAVEAFELEAVDYLLKPVKPPRFAAAVQRLERSLSAKEAPPIRHEATDRICLRTNERTIMVPIERIAAMVADGDFTRVMVAGEPSILVCHRIGHYEETLPSPPFLRVDRSLIVHLENVQRIDRISRSNSKIYMKGLSEPVLTGRTGTEHLQDAMDGISRKVVSESSGR